MSNNKEILEYFSKIKNVTFTQNIQPLVESSLTKITENANIYIKEEIDKVNANYSKLIKVLEALASYFDNSIGVSDDAKAKLHKAIDEAKAVKEISFESVAEIEEPKEEEKVEVKQSKIVR